MDRFHNDVKALLEKNGAMGVNALAAELSVPLSTMQKYLDKQQTYFIKNLARKWELPDNQIVSHVSEMSNNYVDIVDSQIKSMRVLTDTLMSQFTSTLAIISANRPVNAPVAGQTSNMQPSMDALDKNVKMVYVAFKKYMSVIPEEYQELIKNVDLYELSFRLGWIYTEDVFLAEISHLMTEQSTTLSDDTLKVLETYQKE